VECSLHFAGFKACTRLCNRFEKFLVIDIHLADSWQHLVNHLTRKGNQGGAIEITTTKSGGLVTGPRTECTEVRSDIAGKSPAEVVPKN